MIPYEIAVPLGALAFGGLLVWQSEREVRQLMHADEARRRVAEVPLDRTLVQEAQARGVDVRQAAESGLRAALRRTET